MRLRMDGADPSANAGKKLSFLMSSNAWEYLPCTRKGDISLDIDSQGDNWPGTGESCACQ